MEKLKEIDITEENLDIPVSEFVTNRIIELCEQRHFSMYHLCQVTGIAQSSLSYIRKGKILPTLTTLDKFCEGLGITVYDFFERDTDRPVIMKIDRVLFKYWEAMDDCHKKQVLAFMKGVVIDSELKGNYK